MKKLFATVLLLSLSAFAGDLHLGKHALKASSKAGKASGKAAFKLANKARKQLL